MPDLTILMPCLDEAETLAVCIRKARAWAATSELTTEILVADNGSTDGSIQIAESMGARVVNVEERGYGAALFAGCEQAGGRWIIIGDADDSYDFSALDGFVAELQAGHDLVMGNRFRGGIAPGAMPWKNRYVGNPLLSWTGRVLFRIPIRDFHCGIRGLTAEAFRAMDLRTSGMEFASEMVIKSAQAGMRITEVPTTLSMDGRTRPPHLRPWRDGWRHLRFMLLFSPRWLFVFPGLFVLMVSLALYVRLLISPWKIGQVTLDVHTLFFAQTGVILGILLFLVGVVTRALGTRDGSFGQHRYLKPLDSYPAAEVGALVGAVTTLLGLASGIRALADWGSRDFGPLPDGALLRTISFSTSLLSIGGIIFVFSLLLGFISLPTRGSRQLSTVTEVEPARLADG